ncbi:MAG: phytoene synthase [Cryomorphaceae bacterium]|jgi:phytoene synthase
MQALQPQQTMAKHGQSFYWASIFLGPQVADRAARLYQFCRFVDDLADGDLPDRQESLVDIRARLARIKVSAGPEIESFIELAKETDIPLQAAQELLDGMLSDQKPVAFLDERALLRYCHAVAGTVGLMMCRVLNCEHSRADQFAIDLGVAMQLTNIARDVLDDAKMGRRYLPETWINLDAAMLANPNEEQREAGIVAIQKLLDLAERYYQSAMLGIQLLPLRSRLSITIALRVYRQIGIKLQHNHMAWWQGRTVVGKASKVWLSFKSLFDLIPVRVPGHRHQLHRHLQGLSGVDAS